MMEQSGRSLVEILGVLAIGAVVTVAAVGMYAQVRGSTRRQMASVQMSDVARDVKLLMGARGDYTGVSVPYLVQMGALKNTNAPIGDAWSVDATDDGAAFAIRLDGLSAGECAYFETTGASWANTVLINGYEIDDTTHCFSTATNRVSFIVK